ncbi:ribulokinase [Porifericola rhodea]|uniref:ribulokinase n=1 Tax=Porifericola rhodea TaxID=930972 RepID=UPI0026654929|nr:ribulokinase [Porifericola rhodea]WKN29929.1 ribulokinase [Porifericola rhodea]
MTKYAIGLDYGTNSCRSLIVDLSEGKEVASTIINYPSGEAGVLVDAAEPQLARQHPADYLQGMEYIIKEAIRQASALQTDFKPENIVSIGVDTTGSTPLPVDQNGTPLALLPEFKDNLNAMAWLWKDHTSHAEAEEITRLAKEIRPEYLAKCGGIYSSEWFWSKLYRLQHVDSEVFEATYSFVELCDYLPAVLTGKAQPKEMFRSICAAGHKAMFNKEWGGLPDKEFLSALSPELATFRDRLYEEAYSADQKVGNLCSEWADKLGLSTDTVVAVGAFDAHMGAVGAGVNEGTMVKILGTSTCDVMVNSNSKELADIPGVCGIVDGSVIPGFYGIEAGQSGVGDIFLWYVKNFVPETYGKNLDEKFAALEAKASVQKPGEHGLLALDWHNGNRTVLVDSLLSGLIVGQTLHTKPHDVYRALIEATAFGALTIIKRIEAYGVPVKKIVNCGGLATKNPMLMQIYADITGRPMVVARSEQTCALGAALLSAVAAGAYPNIDEAQQKLCGFQDKVYHPKEENHQVYTQLYELYLQMHDAFGTSEWTGNLAHLMKKLISIRNKQAQANHEHN